jgi:inorganic pyrophosphatase
VETPKNGRLKYKYNEKYGMSQLDKTLPYGFSFPFEFGFVPSTIGERTNFCDWSITGDCGLSLVNSRIEAERFD